MHYGLLYALRAHDCVQIMRASQMLTEKSVNEKLKNRIFKYKFRLLGKNKLFKHKASLCTSNISKNIRIQSFQIFEASAVNNQVVY